MNKIMYLLPLLTVLILGSLHLQNLSKGDGPQIIDAPLPKFQLPIVMLDPNSEKNGAPFTEKDFPDDLFLVNLFATWCTTCALEHAQLMRLSNVHQIPIYGIAFRDKIDHIRRLLTRTGNPYSVIIDDPEGYSEGYWDIQELPHTFIVDAKGRIRYDFKGPVKREDLFETVLPLIEKIRGDQI